jgi:hypothetical protein
MGKRTQEVQKKAANTPKNKGLKKKANPPRKKPVNRNAMLAAERKKEREEALAERLAERRAARKKDKGLKTLPNKPNKKVKPLQKNILRDRDGNPVKSGSGSNVRTNDFSKMTQEEIDKLYNM